MIYFELAVVLVAIVWGARLGGLGLGLMGALGLVVLVFAFHLPPTQPPIDVLLLILAVVTATSVLQAAGGLDLLVLLAERLLRRHPQSITYLGPLIAFLFTLFAGTGHVAYSLLPIIAEVARETGVRPERPLAVSVIASQQAITASPVSAATVALLGMTSGSIELVQILMVCIPACLIGILAAAFVMNRVGLELDDDPHYQARLKLDLSATAGRPLCLATEQTWRAKCAVGLFFAAIFAVIAFGSFPDLRPSWVAADGVIRHLDMPTLIEMLMLGAAALILLVGKVKVEQVTKAPVFQAGAQAVVAIFGVAWMGDTFFAGNQVVLGNGIKAMVTDAPWTFSFALFVFSILLFSQAATVRALMPLGLSLGIPSSLMVAMFPAVNGYFFLPNYPTLIAAIEFDTTGTTRIGRFFLNHSFMLPGMIALVSAVSSGFLLTYLLF